MDRRRERVRRRRYGMGDDRRANLRIDPVALDVPGVFGAGVVWFIGRPDVPPAGGLGAGLMLTTMLMHGLWDAGAAIAATASSRWYR